MAQQAAIIKVNQSLIPIPPEAFPKNLSRTAREDAPESMFPILAYDGKNILPTPWGYRSYFNVSEKLAYLTGARTLGNVKCETIFWYQSRELDNVLVALCSDGIYITNTDLDVNWLKVVDLAAYDTDPTKRNQWTFCTINNQTYAYLQGTDGFYGIYDSAKYAEAATPTIIAGASVTQVAINWNVGVVKIIPNFLNMAGQLGIFKAGNRLGFWDSDDSVSWSSAFYVEDFKPDVVTLAGFSKFSDLVGSITKIVQHGNGFIIYATRSILRVINNAGEKSKFSGSPILSQTGVLFDRQIAMAQPDTVHYVLTSSGLYVIENFQATPMATDILDGVIEANDFLSIDYIDGRYLFINTLNGWDGSTLAIDNETYTDIDGNEYEFPKPSYPDPGSSKDLIENLLEGRNSNLEEAFKDFEPIDNPPHFPANGEALVPCYDIKIFKSTWAEETYVNNQTGTELVDSRIKLGITYLVENLYGYPVVTVNSIEADDIAPGDFAGEDAAAVLNDAVDAFNAQVDYQNAWREANAEITSIAYSAIGAPPDDYQGGLVEVPIDRYLMERRVQPKCILKDDLTVEANKCRTHVYLSQDRLMELLVYFEGVEQYSTARHVVYLDPLRWSESIVGGESTPLDHPFDQCTCPKMWMSIPTDDEIIAEYNIDRVAAGLSSVGSVTTTVSTPLGIISIVNDERFAGWLYIKYRETIIMSPELMGSLDVFDWCINEARRIATANGQDSLALTLAGYVPIGWGWYALRDGGSWVPINDPMDNLFPGAFENPEEPGVYAAPWFASNVITGVAAGPGVFWEFPQLFNTEEEVEFLQASLVFDLFSQYKLIGTLSREMNLLPNIDTPITVYDMELSGFGYFPSGGFSFRKTHNRYFSTSCPPPGPAWAVTGPDPIDPNMPTIDGKDQITPPYEWEYPDSIPLPPNYWLTKKGSAAPLFPVYTRSLVYDTQLEKWGISNMEYRAICAFAPVNRTDETIVPVHDYGMLAATLDTDGKVSFIKPGNPDSYITYGKIGQYRLGMSTLSYLKAQFVEKFNGQLIIETSIDGNSVDPTLSLAADFSNTLSARFPFTSKGAWFNMRVQGDFTLKHIECFIEGRSRR